MYVPRKSIAKIKHNRIQKNFYFTMHSVICICNDGYEVSLEKRRLYEVVLDFDAAKHHKIRIIDESGEDYFYPENYFIRLALPQSVECELAEAA